MRVCVIANFSDRRCGFQNFAVQTVTALRRAGHLVTAHDGTYSTVYARQQDPTCPDSFFPADIADYDVVHVIWAAQTLNHYAGADWTKPRLISWWDGGPSNCCCPFEWSPQVKWTCYDRRAEGYIESWYPVPDWVEDLPEPNPVFTVGATSVRGDGVGEIRAVCEAHGWATNLPAEGSEVWIPLEDEVRRLARSTVNVSWYQTPPLWKDKAGAPSMALASGRPLLITRDALLEHLWDAPDLYHGRILQHGGPGLGECLEAIERDWQAGLLRMPTATAEQLAWQHAVRQYEEAWRAAR